MDLVVLLALLLLDFTGPARELARKIAAPEMVLSQRNLSSLEAKDFAEARRALEAELRARGAKLVEKAPVEARVSLAESLREYVWTAEIRRGEEVETAIVTMKVPAAKAPAPGVVVDRKLLWEQEQPMLDTAMIGGQLAVLEPDRIVLALQGTSGALPARAAGRDPRGRLVAEGDTLVAYLFEGVCRAKPGGNCLPSAEPWLLEGGSPAPGRNYFTLGNAPAFYTSAVAEDRGRPVRLYAGVDGRTRLASGESWTGWGSDIAGVETACGRLALATRPTEPEAIQAYRIVEGQPVAAGDPVEFAGPVTALWSTGASATAVARNSRTGRYAAFSLTVTCSR